MIQTTTEQLRKQVREAFVGMDAMIGWTAGYDPLHTTPLVLREQDAVDRLLWSSFCTHNLSGYLVKTPAVQSSDPEKKIGICVKGCDSRSLVALIQENFLSRDALFIVGIPCRGTVDLRRLMKLAAGPNIEEPRVEGDRFHYRDDAGEHELNLEDVLARKCLRCRHPNPVIYDTLIGEPVAPRATREDGYRDVDALESKSLGERLDFWQSELDRCMRCYACRNACPLCVCQDRCIAESREPRWLTQRMGTSEKFLFHFIHAQHLAGRCTECGECERVCPMEIPVTLMKEKLNKSMHALLGYEAGLDPQTVPPLLTFSPGETDI
ncbi:MAG: 4Fe-4S dicluster domain-containing protein [Syntrophobacteraceae bacterium]